MEREAAAVTVPRQSPFAAHQIDNLFRTQSPQLLRFLKRRTKGHEDAADMVQEAFLRLIRLVSLEAFPVSPEAYLQQIAGNLLRDRARRRAARSEEMHEPLDEESIVDRAPGPADFLDAREMLEAYETALLKLAPKTRRIFLLHRREGLTYAQIAAEAGLSVSGVEKHMMKAIAHIDRALGRP
jgi:RNA polymerase sigma-70 factor (ECF subfamily)